MYTLEPPSAGYSVVSGLIWLKSELIQAFMHALVSCKNEEVPIKNEGGHNISSIVSIWGFFQSLKGSLLRVHSRIWSNFELIRDFMVGLITCKYKEDPIKNEGDNIIN